MQFIVSATVPAAKLIAVDAADFATALGDAPRFAVSTEATLHEEDTTPLALGTGAQGSGVLAVPMRSLFQTDAVAIRMSLYVSWAMRRASMKSSNNERHVVMIHRHKINGTVPGGTGMGRCRYAPPRHQKRH